MNGTCPICDGTIPIQKGTEVTEILSCPECQTRVVVSQIDGTKVTLTQAPAVEEDWGQ